MPAYIAMLRGINVSGHKIVKMDLLRASLAALKFGNVKTYIQSGNIVFETSTESTANLSDKIGKKILRDFGFVVPVFVRTSQEMSEIIEHNPFLTDSAIDRTKLHVTFLSDSPPKAAAELLRPLVVGLEQFHILQREIYLYCPNGYGDTKIANTPIEKTLSIGATTRNWATTNTLLKMAQVG